LRFKTSEKGYDGPVAMLLDAGVVQWVSEVETRREVLRLTPNWLERLEGARELGGELESERLEWENRKRKSQAWRRREENTPDAHYANDPNADGHVEDLRLVEAKSEESPPEPEVSKLARIIRAYLDRSPHDACQLPGWIGNTLWCLDLCAGKPTQAEVREAIDELGGEAYLRDHLRRARQAA